MRSLAADAGFRERWAQVKAANKRDLAEWARRAHGLDLDAELLFDCQVKRIHEYKRQLLNVLHVLALLARLRDGDQRGSPRVVLFAGKAAPGYVMAKRIIKLIHVVAAAVAREPACRGRLAVAFLPNYSVSVAQMVFAACELSEQISTSGTEASGTGNMKAALNGALTIGTLDGANVEIRDEVGEENIFIFGHTAEEIASLRAGGYDPRAWIERSPELARAVAILERGELDAASQEVLAPVARALTGEDRYFLCADFEAYAAAQERAACLHAAPAQWNRLAIHNVAGMGRFSSDRTTSEYASEVWSVAPLRVRI